MAARPRDFRILGALEVVEDGRTVALGGRRQRALLALLLLNPNETLSTARLIDELWGEQPPASAAKTVQVTVSRLRKALGHDADGLVVTRDRGYELRTDPDRIDAHRFERLFASGTRELAAGRPQSAAANLEAAVALWRGPALAELADQPFARHDIARLDDLRIACLEELTDAKLALGRHAEVAGELEGLIGEHPYRERLRAQLMLALYRADRQADALQAYQDARATLVEDLGIDPSERLRDLERAVLAQDPALLLPVAPPRPAPRHPSRGVPLVGRSRELEALTGGLQEAIAGHGGVCLVAGEPGIGKSRLAEELTGQARERGVRVLVGRCWEAGGAPAYWPWVQALRTYLRDAEPGLLRAQIGRDGPYLATILPEVREVVPDLPAAPALDSEGARFHLLEAVAAFLRSIASAGPIALFLDDLHAADAPSLLLLRFVAGDLAGAPILVVGCYRDTEVGPELRDALAVLAREPAVRRITLGGLSGADTSRLLELTMGAGPAADLAERVQAETQGNPLFSTEIARLIASQGDAGDSGRRLPIPEGVSEAIGRRLESRSDACRALLTFASVVGREFDPEVVGRVSEIEDDDILLAVDEAAAARLVEGSPEGGGRLRFSHILVRDTLYEGLPAPRRARLHRSLAEVLETSYAGNLDPHVAELAYHYGEGGTAVAAKALDYARRAGSRAAAQFGHEEAARHYVSALRIAETTGTGDAQTTCELLVALGEAQSRAGNGPEAKRTLHRAAMLAEQEGRPDLLTRAALGYGGRFAWARSSSDPALVPLLDRALTAVGEEDSRERARLLGRLATAYRDEPIRDHRARLGAEAVEIATRLGDPETLADALQGQFIAIEGPDIAGSGLDVTAKLIALADQTGDKERAFQGHDHRIHIFWQRGERAALDVELDEIARLAEELGQPAQRWHVGTGQTMLALMEGRFGQADELIAETLALGRRTESWNALVSQRLALFVLRREQGRLAELEDTIRRSVHEYPTLLRFRCALVHLYAELGREGDTRASLDELLARDLAHEYLDAEWTFSITLLADPCGFLGDRDAAAKIYEMLRPYERRYSQAPVEAVFGAVARALGVLATVLRRFDDAERHFDVAIDLERRMGGRPWLAHARHGLAEMLLSRGSQSDAGRAQALLAEAIATYRDLGMESWAARAATLEAAGLRA